MVGSSLKVKGFDIVADFSALVEKGVNAALAGDQETLKDALLELCKLVPEDEFSPSVMSVMQGLQTGWVHHDAT